MEAVYYATRANLRRLMILHPTWTRGQLAQATGMSKRRARQMEETWKIDLEEKPVRNVHMGVQAYFAYDPYEPLLPESANRRLFGWELDRDRRKMRVIPPGPDGSLWSHLLDNRLVPDGATLRLYDYNNEMRLTYAEEMARQADELIQRTVSDSRRIQVFSEKLRSLGIDPDQII